MEFTPDATPSNCLTLLHGIARHLHGVERLVGSGRRESVPPRVRIGADESSLRRDDNRDSATNHRHRNRARSVRAGTGCHFHHAPFRLRGHRCHAHCIVGWSEWGRAEHRLQSRAAPGQQRDRIARGRQVGSHIPLEQLLLRGWQLAAPQAGRESFTEGDAVCIRAAETPDVALSELHSSARCAAPHD